MAEPRCGLDASRLQRALLAMLDAELGREASPGRSAPTRSPPQTARPSTAAGAPCVAARSTLEFELDLRLRRSAEGGLALDPAGRAIGMTVFGPRRRVLVIPSATIARVAARLESHGRIPGGYFGLGLRLVAIEGGGTAKAIDLDRPLVAALPIRFHQPLVSKRPSQCPHFANRLPQPPTRGDRLGGVAAMFVVAVTCP